MTAESYIKAQLLHFAIQQGARHGGVNNMLAAAQVIANRVRAGWYGGEWLNALDRADEHVGTDYHQPWPTNLRDPNVKRAMFLLEDVYHGTVEADLTEGALYFAEAHNITRPWFIDHIARHTISHALVAKVGEVSFFL